MCIAIVQPVGGIITDEEIRSCAAANPHGGGYAYVHKGKVVVKKGYFNVEKFLEDYRADEAKFGKKSPFLLHFRISTGGKTNEENCHPFEYEHGAMIHNGYFFSSFGDDSDTNVFVQKLGPRLSKEAVAAHTDKLSEFVGSNKVAFLFHDRSYSILNARQWTEHNGTIFSNTSYRRIISTYRAPTAGSATPVVVGGPLIPSGHRWNEEGRLDRLGLVGEHRGMGSD